MHQPYLATPSHFQHHTLPIMVFAFQALTMERGVKEMKRRHRTYEADILRHEADLLWQDMADHISDAIHCLGPLTLN